MHHRLLFCWVWAIVGLGPASLQAQPHPAAITIEKLEVGFPRGAVASHREAFKPGAWTPVSVDLTAGPKGINQGDFALVVESSDSDDSGNLYVKPIGVQAANSGFRVQTLTKPGGWTKNIRVTVRRPITGRPPSEWPEIAQLHSGSVPSLTTETLCLTIGTRPSGLQRALEPPADAEAPVNAEVNKYALASLDDVRRLPAEWLAYDAVDVLVLTTRSDQFLNDLFEDPQYVTAKDALLEWVRRGGRLVLSVGQNQDFFARNLQQPKHRDLEALLPATVGDKVQRQRLNGLRDSAEAKQPFPPPDDAQGTVTVARLAPKPGATVVAGDREPLRTPCQGISPSARAIPFGGLVPSASRRVRIARNTVAPLRECPWAFEL